MGKKKSQQPVEDKKAAAAGDENEVEDEVLEEDELELLQVDLGDMVKLKQILDEAVAATLLEKLEEDYRLDNAKLTIMIVACLFAVVAQFAPVPFPDSRPLLGDGFFDEIGLQKEVESLYFRLEQGKYDSQNSRCGLLGIPSSSKAEASTKVPSTRGTKVGGDQRCHPQRSTAPSLAVARFNVRLGSDGSCSIQSRVEKRSATQPVDVVNHFEWARENECMKPTSRMVIIQSIKYSLWAESYYISAMFIFEGLLSSWNSLVQNLWKALGFEGKEGTLLLLGLDNAGKTTLLHRLRTGDVRSFPPTDRPHQSEKFECQGITFQAWDMGGHEAVRHIWEDYVCECSAVIFLLDSSDSARLEEAGFELDALIGEKIVADIPVAVLFNKCDLDESLSSKELCEGIKFDELQKIQGRDKLAVFRISVLKGEGYQSAFNWVSKFL
eukprot:scaffold91_cov127-Cylindrotheca_fusiformis.AAC.20